MKVFVLGCTYVHQDGGNPEAHELVMRNTLGGYCKYIRLRNDGGVLDIVASYGIQHERVIYLLPCSAQNNKSHLAQFMIISSHDPVRFSTIITCPLWTLQHNCVPRYACK